MLKKLGVGRKEKKDNTLVGKVVMVGQYSVRVEQLVGEGGFAFIYRWAWVGTGGEQRCRVGHGGEGAAWSCSKLHGVPWCTCVMWCSRGVPSCRFTPGHGG
jgi:hypothetical protein